MGNFSVQRVACRVDGSSAPVPRRPWTTCWEIRWGAAPRVKSGRLTGSSKGEMRPPGLVRGQKGHGKVLHVWSWLALPGRGISPWGKLLDQILPRLCGSVESQCDRCMRLYCEIYNS